MGQNSSHPQQMPPAIPHSNISTAYESTSEYTDEPSFMLHNIPIIEGIAVKPSPSTHKHKSIPDPLPPTSYPARTKPTTNSSSSSTYQPTKQLLREARQQYLAGTGIFYSLATHKLRASFLHPVDLTLTEFLALTCAEDGDAWIAAHRAELVHRMISRRAQAQRELQAAGIPHRQLRGVDMYELMNAEERGRFVGEFKRQQGEIEDGLRDAMGEDIGPPAYRKTGSVDKQDIKIQQLERARSMETMLSSEERNLVLRRRRSVFASLGWVFRSHHSHRHKEPSGSSEEMGVDVDHDMGAGTRPRPRPRRLSKSWRRSVHSLRHMFGHRHTAFRRPGIRGVVYVE